MVTESNLKSHEHEIDVNLEQGVLWQPMIRIMPMINKYLMTFIGMFVFCSPFRHDSFYPVE